jgi:Zn-dependent protease
VLGLIGAAVYGLYHRGDISEATIVFFLVFIPAVIFHEVAHGVVALWCGDDTAKRAKRLTLNPLRHVDPFGSIILPILLVITVGTPFGWAKPVPVRIDQLRHPRNQSVLVGLAGPATNIILAAIAGALYRIFYTGLVVPITPAQYASTSLISYLPLGAQILITFGVVNVILAAFNLIPIPPLDGSALLERAMPQSWLGSYYRMRMGFLLVVLFVVFAFQAPLDHLFGWVQNIFYDAIGGGPVLCLRGSPLCGP